MNKNLQKFKKATALTALFTFGINTLTGFTMGIVPAQGAGGMPVLAGSEYASVAQYAAARAIPEQAGTIGEIFSAPAEHALIYHIQDAHTSLEAQQNIKKILEHMTRDSKIDTLFLEGTLEEVHGDWMRFFQDDKANARAAQLLAKQGLIGGAELFLLEHDRQNKNLRILGVEDRDLYLKNLNAYRAVLNHKAESEKFLSGLQSQITTAASRLFNKKLGLFFKEWVSQTETLEDPFRHFETLEKAAQEILGMNWDNPRSQKTWPQFYRLVQLNKLEKTADLALAKQEQAALQLWCADKKVSEESLKLVDLIAGVLSSGKWPNENPRGDMETMDEALRSLGFSFKTYPALSNRLGQIILRGEIDAQTLMKESTEMRDQLLEKMAVNADEKKLIQIYKDYLLLKSLLALELSSEDFTAVNSRQSSVLPGSLEAEVSAFGVKSGRLENKSTAGMQTLALQALEFYKIAHERDQAISEKMLGKMQALGKHEAILITGGFHSAGLHDLWKRAGVSFVEVTPHLSEIKKDSGYEDTLLMKGNMKTRLTTVNHPSFGEGPVILNRLPSYGSYMEAMGMHVRNAITTGLSVQAARESVLNSPRSRMLNANRVSLAAMSEVRNVTSDDLFAAGYQRELTMIPPHLLRALSEHTSSRRRQQDNGYLVVPAQVEILESIVALSEEPIADSPATLDAVFQPGALGTGSSIADPISAITPMTPEAMRHAVEVSHGFGEGSVVAKGFTATTRQAAGITYDGVIVDYTLTVPSMGTHNAKATLIFKDGNLITITDFITLDQITAPVTTTSPQQSTPLPLSLLTSSNYALATGNYHNHYAIYVGTQNLPASSPVTANSPAAQPALAAAAVSQLPEVSPLPAGSRIENPLFSASMNESNVDLIYSAKPAPAGLGTSLTTTGIKVNYNTNATGFDFGGVTFLEPIALEGRTSFDVSIQDTIENLDQIRLEFISDGHKYVELAKNIAAASANVYRIDTAPLIDAGLTSISQIVMTVEGAGHAGALNLNLHGPVYAPGNAIIALSNYHVSMVREHIGTGNQYNWKIYYDGVLMVDLDSDALLGAGNSFWTTPDANDDYLAAPVMRTDTLGTASLVIYNIKTRAFEPSVELSTWDTSKGHTINFVKLGHNNPGDIYVQGTARDDSSLEIVLAQTAPAVPSDTTEHHGAFLDQGRIYVPYDAKGNLQVITALPLLQDFFYSGSGGRFIYQKIQLTDTTWGIKVTDLDEAIVPASLQWEMPLATNIVSVDQFTPQEIRVLGSDGKTYVFNPELNIGGVVAASNPRYAFSIKRESNGTRILRLIDLLNWSVSTVDTQSSYSNGTYSLYTAFDVSADNFSGGPVIVFNVDVTGPHGQGSDTHVRRVSNLGQSPVVEQIIASSAVSEGAKFQNFTFTDSTVTIYDSKNYGGANSTQIEFRRVLEVNAAGILVVNNEVLARLVSLGTSDINNEADHLVIVQDKYRSDVFALKVFDSARGLDNLTPLRRIDVSFDSSGNFTRIDTYTTPQGRRIISASIEQLHAYVTKIMDADTGATLDISGGVMTTKPVYNGANAIYILRLAVGGETTITVDLASLEVVTVPANPLLEQKTSTRGDFMVQRYADALVLLNKAGVEIRRIPVTGTVESIVASATRFYWTSKENGLPVIHSLNYSATAAIKNYSIPKKLIGYGIQGTAYNPKYPLVLYVKPANHNLFKITYFTDKGPVYQDLGKKGKLPAGYVLRSEVRHAAPEAILDIALVAANSVSEVLRRDEPELYSSLIEALAKQAGGEVEDSALLLQVLSLMKGGLEGIVPQPAQGVEHRSHLYLNEVEASAINGNSAYELLLLALAPRLETGSHETNEIVLYVRGDAALAKGQIKLIAKTYAEILLKLGQPQLAHNLILVNASAWNDDQVRRDMVKRRHSIRKQGVEKVILSERPEFLAGIASAAGTLRVGTAGVKHDNALLGADTLLGAGEISQKTLVVILLDELKRLGVSDLLAARMVQLMAAIKIAVSA